MHKNLIKSILIIIAMAASYLFMHVIINESVDNFVFGMFNYTEYVYSIIYKCQILLPLVLFLVVAGNNFLLDGPSIIFRKKIVGCEGNKIKIYILSDGKFTIKGNFTIDEYEESICHVDDAMESEEIKDKILYYKIKKKYLL